MFCKQCGAALKDDANFCLKCGAKIIKSNDEADKFSEGEAKTQEGAEKEEKTNLHKQQAVKTFTIRGGRLSAQRFRRIEIPTEITVNHENVHVKVSLKRKMQFDASFVNGEMQAGSSLKDVKSIEEEFQKTDVMGARFEKKLLWYVSDYVTITIGVIIALLGLLVGMFGFSLIIAAVIALFIATSVRCQHLVILLKNGRTVNIPISDRTSAKPFLDELGVSAAY